MKVLIMNIKRLPCYTSAPLWTHYELTISHRLRCIRSSKCGRKPQCWKLNFLPRRAELFCLFVRKNLAKKKNFYAVALKLNSALIYLLSSIRRSIETARNYSQREPHGNSARNLPNDDAPWAPPIITLICSRVGGGGGGGGVRWNGEGGPALGKWSMGWAIGKLDFYALPGGCKQTNQLWIIIAHQSFSQSAPHPPLPLSVCLSVCLASAESASSFDSKTKHTTGQGRRQTAEEQAKFQNAGAGAVGRSRREEGGMP